MEHLGYTGGRNFKQKKKKKFSQGDWAMKNV